MKSPPKDPDKALAAIRALQAGCPDADWDDSYLQRLSPEELAFLAQFGAEYYNGNRFDEYLQDRAQMREVWRRRKRLEKDALHSAPRGKLPRG